MRKLYLIFAKEVGRVKIGISENPEKRLKQLQTGSPVRLELFAFKSHRSASIKENELHERFKTKRVIGEWFELSPEDYVELLKEWEYDPGLHFLKRNVELIEEGAIAFISFDSHSLCEVEVLKYDFANNKATVKILRKIGRGVGELGGIYALFADEIRRDPIDALISRVTM